MSKFLSGMESAILAIVKAGVANTVPGIWERLDFRHNPRTIRYAVTSLMRRGLIKGQKRPGPNAHKWYLEYVERGQG
jgi:hypothetical protein